MQNESQKNFDASRETELPPYGMMIQGRRVCAKLLREMTLLKRVLSLVFVQKIQIAFRNGYTKILQRTYTSRISYHVLKLKQHSSSTYCDILASTRKGRRKHGLFAMGTFIMN
ncbi:hypothetical protein ABFX02_11G009100 [Erythranthe guttata]